MFLKIDQSSHDNYNRTSYRGNNYHNRSELKLVLGNWLPVSLILLLDELVNVEFEFVRIRGIWIGKDQGKDYVVSLNIGTYFPASWTSISFTPPIA